MSTSIYSKKAFIKMIEDSVKDNQRIVITSDLTGTVGIKKKSLQYTVAFASDAFRSVGVGHIAFGTTLATGVIVADKNEMSDLSNDNTVLHPSEEKKTSAKKK